MNRALVACALSSVVGCAAIAGVRELSVLEDAAAPTSDAALDSPGDGESLGDGSSCPSDTDPSNCGECGYACPGTACTQGSCAPTLIATSAPGGRGLVLSDDDFLFWATPSSGVVSVAKLTLAGSAGAASPPAYGASVASHRAGPAEQKQTRPVLFYSDAPPSATPAVRGCRASAGLCIPPPYPVLALVPLLGELSSPAPHTVCWSERGDAGAVRCVDDDGGALQIVAQGVRDPSPLVALADGGVVFGGTDGVGFCPLTGCAGAPRMDPTAAPVVALAIGADGALYVATRDGDVLRRAGTTGEWAPLASGQGTITSLAVGDRRLYWTTLGGGADAGALMGLSLADGSIRTLARQQHAPRSVVADDLRVYWLTSGEDVGHSSIWALPP
jgi:hypothetical protein